MTTRNRQRAHDIVAVKAAVLWLAGAAVAVHGALNDGDWELVFIALAGLSTAVCLWLRLDVSRSRWREGYRQAVDDVKDGRSDRQRLTVQR